MVAGIKEIASRPPAALGLLVVPDAALPVLGLRALRVRALREEPGAGRRRQGRHPRACALGARRARRWRARPGARAEVEGPDPADPSAARLHDAAGRRRRWSSAGSSRWQGSPAMLFAGFFAFFLGKISADTITQQAMPDDFRGRAFALFDIAYNLGFIVPAMILSFIWVENSAPRTRVILMVSGVVFLLPDRAGRVVGADDPRSVRAAGRPGRDRRVATRAARARAPSPGSTGRDLAAGRMRRGSAPRGSRAEQEAEGRAHQVVGGAEAACRAAPSRHPTG